MARTNLANRIEELWREQPEGAFSAQELAMLCKSTRQHVHNAISELRARGIYPQNVRVYRLPPTSQERLRAGNPAIPADELPVASASSES